MTGSASVAENPFELVSIRRSGIPPGAEGSDWHHYVIKQGDNEIQGYRQGSLAAVTAAVEQIVVRLNERRTLKGKRTHIVLKGRKPRQS